jgi:hypothetical protein
MKKDAAPTETQTVYIKNDIMYVPAYDGKGWVGPGYFHENNKVYTADDFAAQNALMSSYPLWPRLNNA